MIYGCVCDAGYSGFDCSIKNCPTGDDPLTTGQVNEVQLIKCSAIAGGFVLYYNGSVSPYIRYTASASDVAAALLAIPLITGIKVSFSISSGTACSALSNVISIEFTNQFGPQSPLVAVADATMIAQRGSILVAADGVTSITASNGVTYKSVKGTKENDACSNRGYCSTVDGVCSCYATNGDVYSSSNGYGKAGTRGDCGYVYSGSTVSSCPGEVQCSGHGLCVTSTHRCSCDVGWTGGDCSERVCPTGLSWFAYPSSNEVAHNTYTTCSSMGTCDIATGECTCASGFYGDACERMACGGGTDNACSGHGRCMSMSELALWAELNGDATSYTYGSDPNNAATWDGSRVHGCLCDEGFHGYDCSLMTCPSGDDPGTYNDHSEVQLLKCTANTGYFTLTFRQFTTPNIPVNASRALLQQYLSNLPSINTPVNVYFTLDFLPPNATMTYTQPHLYQADGLPSWGHFDANGTFVSDAIVPPRVLDNSTVCDSSGLQLVIIDFATVPGDLPPLTASVSALSIGGNVNTGSVTISTDGATAWGMDNGGHSVSYRSIKGTTENDICNNRGLCNTNTGICACFAGWSSGDGHGGPGNKRDCGYRNDHLYSSFNSYGNGGLANLGP